MENWLSKLMQVLIQIAKGNKWFKFPILFLLYLIVAGCEIWVTVKTLLSQKMRRRILASTLSLCMAFTLMPMTAFAAPPSDIGVAEQQPDLLAAVMPIADQPWDISKKNDNSITATLSADKTTLTISGTGDMKDWTNSAEVPWDTDKASITTVTISEGVTSIGANAFDGCTLLTSADSPDVTVIGANAFYQCSALTSVNFPEVTTIGSYAFRECSKLTSINFPEVTTIGRYAFQSCSVLESAGFPKVTSIGAAAFQSCSVLVNISFPEVITIDNYAFQSCSVLTSADFPKVMSIGTSAFQSCSVLETLKLPAEPPSVATSTFLLCPEPRALVFVNASGTPLTGTDLTAAQAAYKVVADGDTADNLWYGWTITAPPATETKWDIGAPTATDITATLSADKTTLTISGTGDMKGWASSAKVPWDTDKARITTVTISEGVTNIGDGAFDSHTVLTSVTIPESVTSIGNSAFSNCPSLSSIAIPSKVTSIGSFAFFKSALTSVTIPKGVTTMGFKAFNGCTSLATVTISEGVENIGDCAFGDCSALSTITIPSSVTVIERYAFERCTSLATVILNFSDGKAKTIGEFAFTGIKSGASLSVVAKDASPKAFKTWSSTVKSGGTAATFTDATTASTTLTNIPSNCTITAEYESPFVEAEWKVGSETKSGSFANALTAMAANGGSIKLLSAVSTSSLTVLPAQAIALNLNGQVWTSGGEIRVPSSGTLTVTSGTSGSGITSATSVGVTVQPGGTLDLQSGSITCTASGYSGISNKGTLKLSGGTVVSTKISAVGNDSGGIVYLSGTPTLTSGEGSKSIWCFAANAQVIANNGKTGSELTYLTGGVSIYTAASKAGDVVVSGLKDADHAKKFTFNSPPTGLAFQYDDSTKSIKLATAPENAAVPTITKDLSTTQVVYSVGGKAAALDATATVTDGGTITYDWYSNATNSTTGGTKLKVTTATYTPPTTVAGTTYYYCVVKNTNSTATNKTATTTSAVANIKVEAAAPVDKGWKIDEAGNLTISTDAGMTDWVANGRDTHNATLKTATINDAVTKIPAMAFNECKALTAVSALGVKNISSYAFNGCSTLATVNFPKVETIVAFAFIGCDKLENAAFPAVTDIYGKAFSSCTMLATLQLPAAPPDVVNANAFEDCPATRALLLVDADGKPLTGTDLVNAQAAYKAEADGDATDNLWYGWTIGAPPPTTPTVTSVTVTPATVTKKPGSIQKFTAVVNGENSPAQTVKWTVEGTTGSSIDGSGELIVVSTEPDGTFIVRATSTVDTSKSGTATVTVSNTPAATTYTITLDANGGSVSSASITTGTDGKLTSLPTPSRSGSYRFDGWFTAASGGTQVTTETVFTSSATVYAHWAYTGGGSGGGGSSSGGITVTPPAAPENDNPSKGESTVTTPVDKNGNASITVTDKNIADAIAQAKKDAVQGQPISVFIKVETDKAATQITTTLPKTVQETLISNRVESITIASDTVTISFSQTAIQQMNGEAKADITITAAKVNTGELTGDAKALIGSRPMYDFTATYGENKSISNFGGNTVSIAIPYALGNGETVGNIQAIYVDDNGKATFILNSGYNAGAVIFTTDHFSGYGVGYRQSAAAFTDITGHWAKNDIEFAVARELLSGTSATAFSPDTSITREMFVTALGKLAEIDPNGYKGGSFTDVNADAHYAPYVYWATSKGIITGTTATTFSPNQIVTRQEMAVFMSNYAKVTGYTVPKTRLAVTFADNEKIENRSSEIVKSMQMAGVIMSKNGNKFDPTGTATRAEFSAVLHRYVELVIDAATANGLDVNDSGKFVYYENGELFTGTKTIDGNTYHFGADGICFKIDAIVPDAKTNISHIIVYGDTLWDLSRKHKCTVAEIVRLNNIKDPNNVLIGTEIKIPQK